MHSIWPKVTTNLTLYQGHLQTVQYYSEKQEPKIIQHIKTFDKFRIGEKIDEEQRSYCIGGEGRSGNVGAIKAWNLKGCGVWGRFYKWPQTTKWSKGSLHEEKSASGLQCVGIIRAYDVVHNNNYLMCETSNLESPLVDIVRGQEEGVNLDWDKFCAKYPKELRGLHLENFVKTKKQKEEFKKLYPWISTPEDLIRYTPGREKTMANLDESLGFGISGNLGEWSFLNNDDIAVTAYHQCKANLNDKCISEKLT